MKITSRQNKRIKQLAKLQQKKHRDQEQRFLIEGFYPLSFALGNNYPLEELFICPALFREKFDNKIITDSAKKLNIPVTKVTKSVYMKVTNVNSPEGLIAVAPQKHKKPGDFNPPDNGLYLVLESIEKLTHLGELFRIADAAGVDAVIICDMRADIFNPHVLRSSLGTFFSVPTLETSTKKAIEWFRKNAITTIATSPSAKRIYTEVDMKTSTAIVIGTEYTGLSKKWLDKADEKVWIPMHGQVSSLSVTTSAAILVYEALRQRK